MIILILTLIVVVFSILHYLFPLVNVCGYSMSPTYTDGEIIIGSRLNKNIKVGDVIVYKCPNDDNRCVIKRVDKISKNMGNTFYYCTGDNKDESYDSRMYGYFTSDRVVCRVINQRRNYNASN